ncbi:hypothetical protein [Anaeromicrobium sediminis]|uniref:Uncharacterized protein n=1 Tax=Anaeromicrobium sediminis TaxID=1478221 RepID=A0A267MJ90_9FIRM|nr:hypothetical protein [Anaeromicrobium sediminis]PAB59664.1 hypothetical protein CCE28_08850 [Anaeromicrobium sediminis]
MIKKAKIKENTITVLIASTIKSVEFETNVKFEKEYVDEISFCCEKFTNLNEEGIKKYNKHFKCKIPHDKERDEDNRYVPLRMVLGNMANALYQFKLEEEEVHIKFVCDTNATYHSLKRCIQALTRDTQEGAYILEHLKEFKNKEEVLIIDKELKKQGKDYNSILKINLEDSTEDKQVKLKENLVEIRNLMECLKKDCYEAYDVDDILMVLDEIGGALADGNRGATVLIDDDKKKKTVEKLKNLMNLLGA